MKNSQQFPGAPANINLVMSEQFHEAIGSTYADVYSEFETNEPSVHFTDEGQLYLSVQVETLFGDVS